MAKPLRSQLNQIRAWVRQGRTDAWIAHQLEVSTAELREFRRRHSLETDGEEGDDTDLRDEIEAEIAAATRERERLSDTEGSEEEEPEEGATGATDEGATDEDADGEPRPRRRRRRRGRGGRGGGRGASAMQATFDHGDEGYGLWLDPSIADDPTYKEHWEGERRVEVTVEADQIVIKRSD